MTSDRPDTYRRAFLAGLAATGVGLAGCTGNSDDDGTPSPNGTGTPTATPGPEETATPEGTPETTPQQSTDPGSYEPMAPKAATFEDMAYWTAHSGVTLKADSNTVYEGSQSARIEGHSGTIQREFPVPVDLSKLDISLAVKIGGPRATNVRVLLYDTGGNTTELIQGYHDQLPKDWVRINPSINTAGANMQRISRMLITIDGDGPSKKYWVDDIRFHEKTSNKAQIMFSFDYMTRSLYEVVFPEMKQRGMTGTVAVAGDRVGTADRLTVEELKEMKDAGWEIASMSNDFGVLAGQSEDIQRKRIERGKKLIKGWGLGDPVAIMYPKGFCDDTTMKVMEEYHDLGFITFNDSELGLSQSALMGPKLVNRSRPSTAHAVENQLRPATKYNGLYSPQQNVIGPDADNSRSVFADMLDAVKQEIDKGNAELVHPSDLVL
jgi:hypothetical protein